MVMKRLLRRLHERKCGVYAESAGTITVTVTVAAAATVTVTITVTVAVTVTVTVTVTVRQQARAKESVAYTQKAQLVRESTAS